MSKNNIENIGKNILFMADRANPLFMADKEISEHIIILSSSGKGKSALIMSEALRRGVSYDEVEKELEPTEAQKAARKEQEMKKMAYERKRFEAVRKAYWENCDQDDPELYVFNDCLSSLIPDIGKISHVQIEALYMSLPEDIVCSAIRYGFSDSVVRDDIYLYIKNNVDLIRKTLNNKM